MSSLGVAFVTIRPDTRGFRAETERGVTSSIARIAKTAAGLTIGFGLVRGFKEAITSAGDFQKQLNILQAVSGATDTQLGGLREQALQLGKDIKLPTTSAQDAALALTELVKAGLSLKDAQAGVRATLQLATAAQVDNATAAEFAANALNQFQLRGKQTIRVADLLAGAANASSGGISDFAEALKFAGTASHAASQTIDDTVTALAELANQGIQGTIAGTALAGVFRDLQKTSPKVTTELDKLNISLFDQQGNMRALPDLIRQFSDATENMTQQQKTAALQQIFTSRSIQAARVVLLGGVDAYDKLGAAVTRTGNAQRLTEAQTKGFSGALSAFKSNVETLAIVLGSKLLPVLTTALRGLSDLAGAGSFTAAVKISFSGIKDAVAGLVGSIRTALVGHDVLIQPKLDEVGTSKRVPGLIADLRNAITAGVAGADFGAAGRRIGEGISKAITITADAASGLVKGLVSAVEAHSGEIAKVGVIIVATMFVDIFDPGFWIENWQLALKVALTALTVVFTPLKFLKVLRLIPFAKFIIDPLIKLQELLRPIAARFGGEILKGLEDAFPTVTGAAVRLGERLLAPLRALPGAVLGILDDLARTIGQALGFTIRDILSIGGNILRALTRPYIEAVRVILAALRELLRSAAITAVLIVERIVAPFRSLGGRILGPIRTVISDVLSIIVGAAKSLGGAAGDAGSAIVRRLIATLGNLPGRITTVFVRVGNKLVTAGLDLAKTALTIGDAIINGIVNAIKAGAGKIKDAVVQAAKDAFDAAKHFLGIGSPSRLFRDEVGRPIIEGIIAGFSTLSLSDQLTGQIAAAVKASTRIAVTVPTVGIAASGGAIIAGTATRASVAAPAAASGVDLQALLATLVEAIATQRPLVSGDLIVPANDPAELARKLINDKVIGAQR